MCTMRDGICWPVLLDRVRTQRAQEDGLSDPQCVCVDQNEFHHKLSRTFFIELLLLRGFPVYIPLYNLSGHYLSEMNTPPVSDVIHFLCADFVWSVFMFHIPPSLRR